MHRALADGEPAAAARGVVRCSAVAPHWRQPASKTRAPPLARARAPQVQGCRRRSKGQGGGCVAGAGQAEEQEARSAGTSRGLSAAEQGARRATAAVAGAELVLHVVPAVVVSVVHVSDIIVPVDCTARARAHTRTHEQTHMHTHTRTRTHTHKSTTRVASKGEGDSTN